MPLAMSIARACASTERRSLCKVFGGFGDATGTHRSLRFATSPVITLGSVRELVRKKGSDVDDGVFFR